jgi:hypothetical protein
MLIAFSFLFIGFKMTTMKIKLVQQKRKKEKRELAKKIEEGVMYGRIISYNINLFVMILLASFMLFPFVEDICRCS